MSYFFKIEWQNFTHSTVIKIRRSISEITLIETEVFTSRFTIPETSGQLTFRTESSDLSHNLCVVNQTPVF